ncbi:hypothetical protein E4U41_006463 [Claviceps citrina]|nr:hypothetical protein E4U41_006463 [Claviceps citrina]
MAAIKLLERTARNFRSVDDEIETHREVTTLAERSDDGDRILRMEDVIYTKGKEFSRETAFDNVAIVLRPITPQTFGDLIGARSKGGSKGMTMVAAAAFREALLGLKVMHDQGWLHHDLKPTNIGLIGTPFRSVLLDVGTSRHIPAAELLRPGPGTVGTIGYLAPELEMKDYNHSVDIWAMGIILFELTHNYHPWKMSQNPWREGNEKLRRSFEASYEIAIHNMARDYESARVSPSAGYLHHIRGRRKIVGSVPTSTKFSTTQPGGHCYPPHHWRRDDGSMRTGEVEFELMRIWKARRNIGQLAKSGCAACESE